MVASCKSKVLGQKRKPFEEEQERNAELLPKLSNDIVTRMVAKGESKELAKKKKYFEEELEGNTELLPKLPNDVTMQLICTKLPWQTFHVLSSVSRAWLGAIRSHKIHDVRVRSRTAETLALIECFTNWDKHPWGVALYSLRDKAIYQLPTLPPYYEGKELEAYTGCIAIGGKVFFLGLEVWVFDVAGQKKWQECASMQTPRYNFGCAVFEGKIYVFGGHSQHRLPIDYSEVYDPELDSWTKISPMKSARISCDTCAFQNEILVYSGCVYDAAAYTSRCGNYWRSTEGSRDGMEAYNPAKDSWRSIVSGDIKKHEVQVPGWSKPEVLFTAHGRLLRLSPRKIESIDLDKKSVEGRVTYTLQTRSNICHRRTRFRPLTVLVTNDGFLIKGHLDCKFPSNECRLYQSTELGMGKKRIVLEEVERSPSVSFVDHSFLEPIQL